MSVAEYRRWIRNPESREASLPSFFPAGVNRMLDGKPFKQVGVDYQLDEILVVMLLIFALLRGGGYV